MSLVTLPFKLSTMYKLLSLLILIAVNQAHAQSIESLQKDIKRHLIYLADDKLEGRRTGTPGEQKACDYICKQFKKNKLTKPNGWDSYVQAFEVNEGKKPSDNNYIKSDSWTALCNKDFVPMPYSAQRNFSIHDLDEVSFVNLDEIADETATNPHFDMEEKMYQLLSERSGISNAKAIFLYSDKDSSISFDGKSKRNELPVVIIKCTRITTSKIKEILEKSGTIDIQVEIVPNVRTGHNVSGFVDNGAAQTIIIGAHYDHLGFGEDHNSLYTGSEKMIHNGADDNASGTASLISLSGILKKSGSKNFNYLFVAFSGEELGLYGSKYFSEHSPVDMKSVNYMINMDMVGRLNDSTHGLTVGGYGTSPAWGKLIDTADAYFHIKVDSAGIGPSDHTSFYKKDLPVLFFFTGTHHDYHKPSDDADKINYEGAARISNYILNLIQKTESLPKLTFTKTRDAVSTGKSSFKVTMGIMPDYTYSGNGVRVDGVSDNRPAQKAGILTNDVIIQLGDQEVTDVQTYMQALGKHKKGETVPVKYIRGKETKETQVTF